jgi:nucleotide-binding universal stress UspA family protein
MHPTKSEFILKAEFIGTYALVKVTIVHGVLMRYARGLIRSGRTGERRCAVFTHILVPLDRSEDAARAIEPALSLAQTYGARITLLMVMFRAPLSHPGEGAFLDQYVEQHGRQYLDEICATRMRGPSVPVDRVVRLGTAAEGILECAVESYADLIVMSAYGATGTRDGLGSPALKILQEAPCPVLLLRAKPPGEPGLDAG